MDAPLAYFLTFTCYGTWLHGDGRGSIDDEHNVFGTPVLPPDPTRQARERERLSGPPYHLDGPRRRATLEALREIARRKGWGLHAAHVRSNHVHVVVTAEGSPERVLNDFKTAASRRLNRAFPAERGRTRWTRHGSTRYLWTEESVAQAMHYVLFGQGDPLERFPDDIAGPRRSPWDSQPSVVPEPEPEPRTQRSGVSGQAVKDQERTGEPSGVSVS